MNRKLISLGLVLLLALVFAACSQEQTSGEYNTEKDFKVKIIDNGKAVKIIKYKSKKTEVRIPPRIKKRSVVEISCDTGESADSHCVGAFEGKQLTGVTIPDSVTTIDWNAFRDNQLTSVTIPDSVITIKWAAFQNNQLANVTIPDSVTAIEESAFVENQLTSVTIGANVVLGERRSAFDHGFDDFYRANGNRKGVYTYKDDRWQIRGNSNVKIMELGDFNILVDNGKSVEIIRYKGTKTIVQIPARLQNLPVTAIGIDAFHDKQLTSVTIPHTVTAIRHRAFLDNQLATVTIPHGVTSIGKSAFLRNQLTSITIPDSVTTIGESAFTGNQLTNITIGAGVALDKRVFTVLGDGFYDFYQKNGKKGGTYIYIDGSWRTQ